MADESLGGAAKVAAFLLSLDEKQSAQILKHISKDVLTEIADAMTRVDPEVATHARVVELKRQLAVQAAGPKAVQPREEEELGQLLGEGVGPQASREIVDRLRERKIHERPFFELERVPAEDLARALVDESPAVSAVVLAHLDPGQSAAVLSAFDSDAALGIVKRMAKLAPPGIERLRGIAEHLQGRLAELASVPSPPDPATRLKTIASMLNFTAPDIEQSVLQGLSEDDETTAQEIREHMFSWDDLSEIDKRSMQKILGSIDTRTLSIALKACTPQVETNIMSNLSARVRDMVAEERELAGAMPLGEVLAAREQVMTTVRGMIESGEFSPARSGEELVT